MKYLYYASGTHNSTVNILRFSNNGKYLASAGDDQTIIIWTLKLRPIEFGSSEEGIFWSVHKLLRGHSGDIFDLCWSDDSNFIVTGSVDNTAIIWDIEKSNKGVISIKDHQNFVQGVSWCNDYLATQSADRSVNIYSVKLSDKSEIKIKLIRKIKSYTIEMDNLQKNQINFYLGEQNYPSFLRRLSWSPDGNLLLTVAGINKNIDETYENVVWGYLKNNLDYPTFYLPTITPTICIRFNPFLFKNKVKNENEVEMIALPYLMVFAIGTKDSVIIYDTNNINPQCVISNIHYMPITDLSWMNEKTLAVSSSDGYITFISLSESYEKLSEIDNLNENLKNKICERMKVNYNEVAQNSKVKVNNLNTGMMIKTKKSEINKVID